MLAFSNLLDKKDLVYMVNCSQSAFLNVCVDSEF